MIDHGILTVSNTDRSIAFYTVSLAPLGITTRADYDGKDGHPDWPLWYADYLLDKMRQMLKAKFTKSELIYLLVSAEKMNGVIAYWPRFYARFIISRYL
jgi:hypothetical protein